MNEMERKTKTGQKLHEEYPQIWLHYDAYAQDVYNRPRVVT